ncbi:hypothetical protein [Streptomyces nitrosporeus]|uniref:hypothetical protein n=1 Tax=Streptomyces nitrosporeus TaxID=28894 RepID=UPI001E2DE0FC|nr:hypothetical protein [Streptomyces nitrosporeus]
MTGNGVGDGVSTASAVSDAWGAGGTAGAGDGRPTGPGREAADLRHSDGPWLRAAEGAEALRTHLAPVREELAAAHQGLTAGAGVLTALAELGAVRTSWERRFTAAQRECAGLAGKLRAVVREQAGTDEAVGSSLTSVPAPAPAPVPDGAGTGAR